MSLMSFLLCLVTVEDLGGIPVDSNSLPATEEDACSWIVLPSPNGGGNEIVQDGDGVEEYNDELLELLQGDIMHGSCVPSS